VAFNGVLGTLQLLYNIWDLNHGFLGCCHVACKRIDFLVSLRRSAKLLAVILNRAGVQYIYLHIALVASLSTLIPYLKAPRRHCTCSWPITDASRSGIR
jgi:hypothetical protein